jgi:hypothetical protein
MKRFGAHIEQFHDDRRGAILLLMLAAFLILMMVAWVLYDSGDAAREKVKLQAAADTAAMSQASIKARSMNMLAYTNVAKRSIFAIHATYLSHFMAYVDWAALVHTIGQYACTYIDTDEFGAEACNKVKAIGEMFVDMWKAEAHRDFPSLGGFNVIEELELENPQALAPYTLAADWGSIAGEISLGSIAGALFLGEWQNLISELKSAIKEAFIFVGFTEDGGLTYGSKTVEDWSGFTTHYFAQDLKALDNYQRYIAGMTPWWAWTEQLVKGMRNGATASVSFPRPLGVLPGDGLANALAGLAGGRSSYGTILADTLPVRPGDGQVFSGDEGREEGRLTMGAEIKRQLEGPNGQGLFSNLKNHLKSAIDNSGQSNQLDMQSGNSAFLVEYIANLLTASMPISVPEIGRSSYPMVDGNAFIEAVADVGFAALVALRTHTRLMGDDDHDIVGGLQVVQAIFDNNLRKYTASPWVLQRYRTQGSWLSNSSNLIFAYSNRSDLFGESRRKFDVPSHDYDRSYVFDSIYRSSGYWTFAKAEVSFHGEGKPSLWDASWTSRLRPVTLPEEYQEAGYNLNDAYHDVLPTLAVLASLDLTQLNAMQFINDLLKMERATRAMGHETAEGVAK